ncbi:MAG: cation transporter [Candidatus Cloacimonetes bacterium]|nr:cation transporter [Candidatus Cloacimonadota bacterium]
MTNSKKINEQHPHNHSHDVSEMSGTRILITVLLNLFITIAELIGGLVAHSLSLISDSLHNFSDAISVLLTYFAIKISRKDRNIKMTYGYKRAQIIVAFINSSVLFIISIFLVIEAIKRFKNPEEIKGTLMIIVASIGLVANIIGVLLLEKGSHDNMNIKSSYLHLFSDAVSSVGVLLGGVAIKLWNIFWIDPLVTILIALYIVKETWHIIKKSVDILMQSSANLDYPKLKVDIEKIKDVINIHHVHTWYGDEKTIYFEAHIVLKNILISETQSILLEIEKILKNDYGINHVTIQFECENVYCSKEMFHTKKTHNVRKGE